MTLTDSERLHAARWLIDTAQAMVVNGYSSEFVSDWGIGYANGYAPSGMSDVWVTGDWNSIDRYDRIAGKRVTVSDVPKRLFAALERLGVNAEWLDQWAKCDDCGQLIETEPSHYGWTPQYVLLEDGEYVCRDCILSDVETYLDQYIGHSERAVTWLSHAELIDRGWTDAFPSDYDAQHGFHPGQTDTPDVMVQRWSDSVDNASDWQWLFVITDKGQFDVSFRMLVRKATDV